jgi:hypothetical protein
MRALALGVAVTAVLVAGCGRLLADRITDDGVPNINPSLSHAVDATGATFTLDPWPLDGTVAFLCLDEPGDEFKAAHPVPAAAARCTPLDAEANGDRLTLRFDVAAVPPPLQPAFAESASPWYLAVAAARGPTSSSAVFTIPYSPIPSDAGPS